MSKEKKKQAKRVTPNVVIVHFADPIAWIKKIVVAIADESGRSHSRVLLEAFCERYKSQHPELGEYLEAYRKVKG